MITMLLVSWEYIRPRYADRKHPIWCFPYMWFQMLLLGATPRPDSLDRSATQTHFLPTFFSPSAISHLLIPSTRCLFCYSLRYGSAPRPSRIPIFFSSFADRLWYRNIPIFYLSVAYARDGTVPKIFHKPSNYSSLAWTRHLTLFNLIPLSPTPLLFPDNIVILLHIADPSRPQSHT
jgi:hypothetical protein